MAAEDTSAYAAPLSNLVERLSTQPELAAGDYATLARETITWGQRLQGAQQAVTPGPVNDALAGIDAGEKLEVKAADWSRLRNDLEELLKKPPEPPPQQQPQQQPKQNQQQKEQQQQQQNSSNSQEQQPPEEQPRQNPESKPQNPPPPKPPEQANTGGTQKIGGQPQQPKEIKSDPSLALPIQKLDQLRNQDSPAQLFQMLDSRNYKPSPKKGRDW
jgi:Ca-activated chloride channel family protein